MNMNNLRECIVAPVIGVLFGFVIGTITIVLTSFI